MKPLASRESRRGFALILTITLLSLLILALCALSALVKVNAESAVTAATQTQARQNALLGLKIAISEVQRLAGDDTRITGMAGLTGVPAQATSTTRNWCGVWAGDGSFVAWLTSGAVATDTAAISAGTTPVKLAGDGLNGSAGSLGASAAHSEHVEAGRIPIVVAEVPAVPGAAAAIGGYAFVVSDEGVKISAYSNPSMGAIVGVKPLVTSTVATSAQGKMRTALEAYAGRLPSILCYEQLSLLPTPSAAMTQSVLQDNYHHVTLSALSIVGGQTFSGTININTTSPYVWRSILETYNSVPGVTAIPYASLTSAGTAIATNFASSASGKPAAGPFTSVASFGGSALLSANLPATITPLDFMTAIGGLLVTRSDTFRVRAYGDVSSVGGGAVESVAYCEAMLQRTPELASSGFGRKFVVTYFRWLGPDDI